jgi:hypothetical protein
VIVKVMLLVDTHIVNKSMRSINGKTIKSECQDTPASIRGFNDDHVGYLRLANRKMPEFRRELRENASFEVGSL